MTEGSTHSAGMLYFFLAGGLAGAGVALLLAPQSGKDTREAMRRKLHDADDSARLMKERFLRRAEDIRYGAAGRADAAVSANAVDGSDEVPRSERPRRGIPE